MDKFLRIWRVEPTYKGVQAPTFFVETTENGLEKSKINALKQARGKSSLSRFEEWKFNLSKENVRKDSLGRYWYYHQ